MIQDTGDINGDGFDDVLIGNNSDEDEQVWISDGVGGFTQVILTGSGGWTRSIASADVNNDGFDDVLIGNTSLQDEQVWISDGAGNFTQVILTGSGGNTFSIASADVNNDGFDDVLIGNRFVQDEQVWISDGAGNFTQVILTGSGGETESIASADVNGDGFDDVLIGNDGQDEQVWISDGVGNFTQVILTGSGGWTNSIASADVNNDGFDDVLIGNNSDEQVWISDGAGNFTQVILTGSGGYTSSIASADINGDGFDDVLIGNYYYEDSQVWLSDGIGGFINTDALDTGHSFGDTFSIASADVNGDGFDDVLIGNNYGQDEEVWISDGAGNFTQVILTGSGGSTISIASADVNGDGFDDVLIGNTSLQDEQVWISDGAGNFTQVILTGSGGETESIASADINGDGFDDVLIGNNSDEDEQVWISDGVGGFTQVILTGSGGETESIASADVNGDGFDDVLIGNYNSQDEQVWISDGVGGFTQVILTGSGGETESIASADVNGDGFDDVLIGNYNSQDEQVWISDGAGNFTQVILTGSGGDTRSIASADVNGDGFDDVLIGNYDQDGQVWISDGVGNFTQVILTGSGGNTTSIASADVNGDGFDDILLGNSWQDEQVWISDGVGNFTQVILTGSGGNTTSIASADVNGDGFDDILLGNNHSRSEQVWISKGLLDFLSPGSYQTPITADPSITSWDKLLLNQDIPVGTSLSYTILDATCTTPFSGFENVYPTDGVINISSISSSNTELCLVVNFESNTELTKTSVLRAWQATYQSSETPSLSFDVRVVDQPIGITSIDNVVSISTDTAETDYTNNADNDTIALLLTDLELTKEVDFSSANAGDTLTYTLSYQNNGPTNATNWLVEDLLPTQIDEATLNITPANTSGGASVECQYESSERKIYCSNTLGTQIMDVLDPSTLYSVENWDNQIHTVDPTTFVTISSVTITPDTGQAVDGANGLALDPTTGTFYAILKLTSPDGRFLSTIDPSTGVATVIGNPGLNISAIALDYSGTLYALTGDGGDSDLYTLDKVTAVPTLLADYTVDWDGEALAFNFDNGLLYRATGSELYAINPSDPSNPTLVYDDGPSSSIQSMVYRGNNEFIISGWGDIIVADTLGNTTDTGSDLGHTAAGLAFPQTTQTVITSSGTLAVGESGTITITVDIDASTTPGTTLLNTACIETATTETDYTNNCDSAMTVIGDFANVWVEKTGDLQANIGRALVYNLEYGNNGNIPADNVVITDTLDPNVTLISATQTSGSIALTCGEDPAGIVVCNNTGTSAGTGPTLPVGETGTIQINVLVNNDNQLLIDEATIKNTVIITTDTPESTIVDNADQHAVPVWPYGLVAITGTVFLDYDRDVLYDSGVDTYLGDISIFLSGTDIYGNLYGPDKDLYPTEYNTLIALLGLSLTDTDPYPPDYTSIDPQQTDPEGDYAFAGLNPGTYHLLEIQPSEYPDSTGSTAGVIALNLDGTPDYSSQTGTGSKEGNPNPNLITDIVLAETELSTHNDFGELAGRLGNRIFRDDNANGEYEPLDGEIPIPNITLDLYQDTDQNGILDPSIDTYLQTTFTDLDGLYYFDQLVLDDGNGDNNFHYLIQVTDTDNNLSPDSILTTSTVTSAFPENPTATDYSQTNPDTIILDLTNNQNYTADFGYLIPATVGNYVWYDENGNGLNDEPSNQGLNNIEVRLYEAGNGIPIQTTITANSGPNPGYYEFTGLLPGDYFLEFILPPDRIFTEQTFSTFTDNDSDPSPNGRTPVFSLTSGEQNLTLDAGIIRKPPIQIIKSANSSHTQDSQTVQKSASATFYITVINTGDTDLFSLTVSDDRAPDCIKAISSLPVGQSVSYTCYAGDTREPYTNIATVTAPDPLDPTQTLTDSDPSLVRMDNINSDYKCGNGIRETGEYCDDGNRIDDDECNNNCELSSISYCGDGILDAGEACDDGNTIDDDGCPSTCQFRLCPNGILDEGEECDDGNTIDDDTCSNTCTVIEEIIVIELPEPEIIVIPEPPLHSEPPETERIEDDLERVDTLPQTGTLSFSPFERLLQTHKSESIFPDTALTHPHYESAVNLYLQGVIEGYPDQSIRLDQTINRAEALKVILEAKEAKLTGEYNLTFPDTDLKAWYQPYLYYAKEQQIISGQEDGNFYPASDVRLGELSKLIAETFELETETETTDHFATSYHNTLRDHNLLPPELQNKDKLDQVLTRGELFTIINRVITNQDTQSTTYTDELTFSIPELELHDIPTKRTLLSENSVWLTDLQEGIGFYEDTRPGKEGRLIIFGHSTRYLWDTNPYADILYPLIQDLQIDQHIELTRDSTKTKYQVYSRELIAEADVDYLRNAEQDAELILFTCDFDTDKRWIFKAKVVDQLGITQTNPEPEINQAEGLKTENPEPTESETTNRQPFTQTFSPGDTHSEISRLKETLNTLGYTTPQDGDYYSPELEQAIFHFQLDQGIVPNASFYGARLFGKATMRELNLEIRH